MNPIGKPGDYNFGRETEQTCFDRGGQLQAWISEPEDKSKGYVVYFEGNAGHWGDLGVPALVTKHNQIVTMRGEAPSADGTKESRDYRIQRIKALQEHGYGVIAVHLPGFGASKGTPSEVANNTAADELIRWLSSPAQNMDMSNLTIMGASQGANTATYMASKLSEKGMPPKMLALVAPPLSTADGVADVEGVPNFIKGVAVSNQDDVILDGFKIAPLIAHVSQDTKVLVMGGGKDWVVPDHQVNMVAEAAQRSQHQTRLAFDPAGEHATIAPDLIASHMDAFLKDEPAPVRQPKVEEASLHWTAARGNGGIMVC